MVKALQERWEALKGDLLEKLALSMVDRIQAVLRAEGWYIKY